MISVIVEIFTKRFFLVCFLDVFVRLSDFRVVMKKCSNVPVFQKSLFINIARPKKRKPDVLTSAEMD